MKKKIEWNDPCSYIQVISNGDKIRFTGEYCFGGVNWHFSLNEQKSGGYNFRGRMTAFPMDDNQAITKEILSGKETAYDGTEGENPSLADEPPKKDQTIWKSLYLNPENAGDTEKCLGEVKACIEKAATRMFHENKRNLRRFMERNTYTPDKITPAVAVVLHMDRFLRENDNNWTYKTYDEYANSLLNIFCELNAKAMCQYDISTLQDYFKRKNVKRQYRKLARDFWQYCLDRGVCVGNNPVPRDKKSKMSPETKRIRAQKADSLALPAQDALYDDLLEDPSGSACGIALQMWGGLSPKEACDFRWGDVIFSDENPDMVVLRLYKSENKGATHDYSRVAFIQCARILRARKEFLREKGISKIDKLPVVTKQNNDYEPLSVNALNQYTRLKLSKRGIRPEVLKILSGDGMAGPARVLRNTYRNNLSDYCGLDEESGLFKFMCGMSLAGNVTADHYVSYTSPAAHEKQLAMVSAFCPMKNLKGGEKKSRTKDGDIVVFSPSNTRAAVMGMATWRIEPGEELDIEALHGVVPALKIEDAKD